MRATVSTGALPSSRTTPAQTTSGGRAVAAARREGRSPALVVQDIETSPPTFTGAPRPKTSDSTTSGRGGPPSTVARLPVPGSRGSSRSQAKTRPATPFSLLDDMKVGMDGVQLLAPDGDDSLLQTSDPLLQTSAISQAGGLPSIAGSGISPYDENQRLRRELALMRKRYRQLDFELKKEL